MHQALAAWMDLHLELLTQWRTRIARIPHPPACQFKSLGGARVIMLQMWRTPHQHPPHCHHLPLHCATPLSARGFEKRNILVESMFNSIRLASRKSSPQQVCMPYLTSLCMQFDVHISVWIGVCDVMHVLFCIVMIVCFMVLIIICLCVSVVMCIVINE